ncbi:molybdopterin-binding protein [Desulfonatronum sp. SC1]|uniref:molybdopterin-binding protein n=1 Tax=Desulfonatronum sp. SC1 TaxID=2109626 RepID=UPI000D30EC54|nr:molybdopterin-binding protein [Desulfonatronum sp. SC1]PTN37923.1 molybdopterin-binding protein [Desulfonatronum sp. SC1]
MRVIPVEQAVDTVLCHDITRIVPGEFKGRAFRRGHVIRSEDIPALRKLGKDHLYVWDLQDGLVHEDEAALRIARAAAGSGVSISQPSEGRVNLIAEHDGLLKIDTSVLHKINSVDQVVMATAHGNHRVLKGQPVAGTRVIPLVIAESTVAQVELTCRLAAPLIQVKPFRPLRVGVLTTGSEVYHGRIQDKFGPVLRRKFDELGCVTMPQVFVPDDVDMTVRAIRGLIREGAEMLAVTGGMSVDPDDLTPTSIQAAGGRVVTYGAPTFPGAMFLLAFIDEVPVVGLPGCVMYARSSIFDLVVPRLVAGENVTKAEIVAMGHGGLCAGCAECRYPICPFGKGA